MHIKHILCIQEIYYSVLLQSCKYVMTSVYISDLFTAHVVYVDLGVSHVSLMGEKSLRLRSAGLFSWSGTLVLHFNLTQNTTSSIYPPHMFTYTHVHSTNNNFSNTQTHTQLHDNKQRKHTLLSDLFTADKMCHKLLAKKVFCLSTKSKKKDSGHYQYCSIQC